MSFCDVSNYITHLILNQGFPLKKFRFSEGH